MKGKSKTVKPEVNKVFCHENEYRRDCQTGPLKRDRSELCPQCPFLDLFDHELEKGYKFYSEQKALLSAERFAQFLNEETNKPTENMRKAVISADDPGEGKTTNWGNCNGLYIGNKEILQQLKEFREGKEFTRERGTANDTTTGDPIPNFSYDEIKLMKLLDKRRKDIAIVYNLDEETIKDKLKALFDKTGIRNKRDLYEWYKDNIDRIK